MIIKQRREIWLIAIAVLTYWGISSWLEKPYANIEHQDRDAIRGEKPLWLYVFSKLYSQRRELDGNQNYAMYIYIHAPHGIRYACLTIDGMRMYLNVPPGSSYYTYELEGAKAFGLHKYELDVMDGRGNKSHSQAYMTITHDKTAP